MERKYIREARTLIHSIQRMNSSKHALLNFQAYLECHFGEWLQKYANTPEDLAAEVEAFSYIRD